MVYSLIIRISLLLILGSLPVFLLVELLLWLAIPIFPEALTLLGSAVLISSFSLLAIAAVSGILKIITCSIRHYFSLNQQTQRRFRFIQDQQEQIKRLFHYQTKQIKYIHEFKRKRLLKHNNKQHINALSDSINLELLSLKPKLSKNFYQQLQSEHARYKNQQDIQALLILQQKISSLV